MHSTINKYIETSTFTRLQAFCSQLVTFKIWNSSPHISMDRHFLYDFSFHSRAWLLSAISDADVPALSIDRLSGASNRRGEEYICWWSFLWNVPRWSLNVVVTVIAQGFSHRSFAFCLLRYHKILFISRSEKYLLPGRHVFPGANAFGRFFFYFIF